MTTLLPVFDSPTRPPPPPTNDNQLAITKRNIDPDVEDISIDHEQAMVVVVAEIPHYNCPSEDFKQSIFSGLTVISLKKFKIVTLQVSYRFTPFPFCSQNQTIKDIYLKPYAFLEVFRAPEVSFLNFTMELKHSLCSLDTHAVLTALLGHS